MEKKKPNLNREQKRKLKRLARIASKKARKDLDNALEKVFHAKYNVDIRYIDEEKEDGQI